MLKNLLVGLATVAGVVLGLALVGGVVILALKVCLFLFVLFCKLVIPLVAGAVVVAFAGLVLWAVGAAVMAVAMAVRSRA